MLKRLYLVADSIEATSAATERLREAGIDDRYLAVVSRDAAGLRLNGIPGAPLHEHLDVIHTGLRRALLFGAVGLAAGLGMMVVQPFPWPTEAWHVAILTAFTGCFGAWQGGMLGLSREHYRLEPFHEDLEAGHYVMMVDVPPDRESAVEQAVDGMPMAVRRRGEGSPYPNPLETPRRVLHQTTH